MMNFKQAFSWLSQPGIKAMMPADKHTQEALEKAKEALKKQIAIPYVIKKDEERNVDTYHCPCCGLELGDNDWDGEPDKDWLPYCEKCGQKIKWSE